MSKDIGISLIRFYPFPINHGRGPRFLVGAAIRPPYAPYTPACTCPCTRLALSRRHSHSRAFGRIQPGNQGSSLVSAGLGRGRRGQQGLITLTQGLDGRAFRLFAHQCVKGLLQVGIGLNAFQGGDEVELG